VVINFLLLFRPITFLLRSLVTENMGDFKWYMLTFVPIAGCHMMLPPIFYFQGERAPYQSLSELFQAIYSLGPAEFKEKRYVESLMLSGKERTLSGEFQWSRITSLFVHQSYDHLLGNLSGALIYGFDAFKEFGVFGLYAIFLAGGYFATVPSDMFPSTPAARRIARNFTVQEKKVPFPKLARAWNTLATTTTSTVVNIFVAERSCGSSGAVCALIGCHFMLLLRDVLDLVCSPDSKVKGAAVAEHLICSVMGLGTISRYIADELKAENGSGFEDNVDHGAHLQGFMVGVGITFVSGWVFRFKR
jgi:membrane associated rhomboid family serine protease